MPFDLAPEHCFSPATLAKAYFIAMRIKPPREKFKIPPGIHGIAMQAFAAGRVECLIRRTPVPITYLDFHAQFPAVSKLLDCREILCAESLEFREFTVEARSMLDRVVLDDCFYPTLWKGLRWFALVEAHEDVVPIRARFGKNEASDPTLAWNFLNSKQSFWLTGPDAIATKLITGKTIKIIRAIEVAPRGVQPGLVHVKLYSQLVVDPLHDDLAVKFVELRHLLKAKEPKLAGGFKVSANSAAFGLFCQMNVTDLQPPSPLRVFSGETNYVTPRRSVWEEAGQFYCPEIASLVTGGSHLLCAMLERMVKDRGGHIAAMDTDSVMIVSTEDGGFVPCAGGPHKFGDYHLPGGNAAITALSRGEVDFFPHKFEELSPWRETLKTPFLKLEKENVSADGERQQLFAYCVSSKLYCLYNLNRDGLEVRKPSGHGLGFLQNPYTIADWQRKSRRKWNEALPPWLFEAWHFMLARELGIVYKPPAWLKLPAVMTVPLTSPQIQERLVALKDDLRPFTVMTVLIPKRETSEDPIWSGYFIMPRVENLNDLNGRTMLNVVSGKTFHIYDKHVSRQKKPSGWLSLKTMEDEINNVLSRTESKFCTPSGANCTSKTIGLLVRRHISAGEFHYIGREASTRWSSGPDLSMLANAGTLDTAHETFREYERVVDPKYLDEVREQAVGFSTKLLSRQSGLAECAIRQFKNGSNKIKPRSLRKLMRAVRALQSKQIEMHSSVAATAKCR